MKKRAIMDCRGGEGKTYFFAKEGVFEERPAQDRFILSIHRGNLNYPVMIFFSRDTYNYPRTASIPSNSFAIPPPQLHSQTNIIG